MSHMAIIPSQHGNDELNVSERMKQVLFMHFTGKRKSREEASIPNTFSNIFFYPLIQN